VPTGVPGFVIGPFEPPPQPANKTKADPISNSAVALVLARDGLFTNKNNPTAGNPSQNA
jgi:hypothetical protein